MVVGSASPGTAGLSARVTGRVRELTGAFPEPLRSPALALAARPGKCLRSSLLAASAGPGPADENRLVRLGAIVELLHLATLLHDDVVDRAGVRRGAPAAHVVVGNEQAMLAGLARFSAAGMAAAEFGDGLELLVARTVAGLAYGEMLDVERAFDTALGRPTTWSWSNARPATCSA